MVWILVGSIADPDDFCPDPDTTFQIGYVRIQILAHKNIVQTFSNTKFFA
jgi:hypothetical protein